MARSSRGIQDAKGSPFPMLETIRGPISQLSESLYRLRTGEGTGAEIVPWLRAVATIALAVPVPQLCDPHRGYSRTLLHKNDLFEILVLHWKPGCASAIHDHGGAHCWFAVAQGMMKIENYLRYDGGEMPGFARIGLEGREELESGSIDYRQDDIHLHRCIAGEGNVTTLHVYARPIERFHGFDERSQTCYDIASTYDAIVTA
jgi:predicted metal-dependent enzyme (double-stranded beta helix superfamily)